MKQVQRKYKVLDIIVVISLFSVIFYLVLMQEAGEKYALLVKDVIVNLLISVIIAYSAIFITNFVKNKTKQKPNSCLLYWHIFNLVLEISATILRIVFAFRIESEVNECQKYKSEYESTIVEIVTTGIATYKEFFFMYLLYKFTKPRKAQNSDRVVSSSLFAHDYQEAIESFKESLDRLNTS